MLPMLLVIQGVVFAYASVELVGVAAGETENPEKIMPKAINSIMWRVALFYVGSVVLLAMLLPWNAYSARPEPVRHRPVQHRRAGGGRRDEPRRAHRGACPASTPGLYSTGRILRSMAMSGSAPKFTGVMSRTQVPYGGILLTAASACSASASTTSCRADAFEIVLNFAAIGILAHLGHDHDLPPAVLAEDAGRAARTRPATGCPARRGPRS